MFVSTSGLILADDRRIHLGEITQPRALSAVPFGGRYRLIDFTLSNMVNSGIRTVGVSTFQKYQSLMDHLGTGSDWDLDRKNEGLSILAPYIISESYTGESDDLLGILSFFRNVQTEYIVISSANTLFNTTYRDLIRTHRDSGADITVMYNHDGTTYGPPNLILDIDDRRKVREVLKNPENPRTDCSSMGTLVLERQLFINIVSEAVSRGIPEVSVEHFLRLYERYDVRGFLYEGEVLHFNSIQNYFKSTMRTLEHDVQTELFRSETPIYTKVKDEAPAFYTDGASVSNSFISDGCLIEGSVEDSMLFRTVRVSQRATVKNSVIFQGTTVSEGCVLENVIVDKDVLIRPGIRLIGQADYPVVIGKGAVV